MEEKKTTMVCANFHALSRGPIDEPQRRLEHALEYKTGERFRSDPFWIHLLYTGVVLNWWKRSLGYFQSELISHVSPYGRHEKKQSDADA